MDLLHRSRKSIYIYKNDRNRTINFQASTGTEYVVPMADFIPNISVNFKDIVLKLCRLFYIDKIGSILLLYLVY